MGPKSQKGPQGKPQSGVWGLESRLGVLPRPPVAFPSPPLSICIILHWAVPRDLKGPGVLFRSGDTAEPDIEQMDSNGDGNATVGWGWTLNRDPIPQTPLWGPLLAPFSRKTRKKPEILSTNREFFFDSAISQEVGVGSTKLKQVRNVCHPQTLVR